MDNETEYQLFQELRKKHEARFQKEWRVKHPLISFEDYILARTLEGGREFLDDDGSLIEWKADKLSAKLSKHTTCNPYGDYTREEWDNFFEWYELDFSAVIW